jgi:hypothetical protein
VFFAMRIVLAFRVFFAALFRADCAERLRIALEGGAPTLGNPSAVVLPVDPKVSASGRNESQTSAGPVQVAGSVSGPTGTHRSEALTVLSVLQREARLLDLVSESLDAYTDEQIGGAARNVLRDTHKSLQQMFGLQPLSQVAEGDSIPIPKNASPMRWRIAGNTASDRGTLAHAGWVATRVELPKWSGVRDDAWVIAPLEVETRM